MTPKARILLDLLTSHESALTYDFQSIHGLRLLDTVKSRTTSELLDLVMWLPGGSAFRASIEAQGDQSLASRLHGWDMRSELLLASVNLLLDQTYVFAQAHSKRTLPKPKHLAGPRGPEKSSSSKDDANAMARALMGSRG